MEAIEAATHAQAPAGNVYGLGAETPSRRRVTDDVFDMGVVRGRDRNSLSSLNLSFDLYPSPQANFLVALRKKQLLIGIPLSAQSRPTPTTCRRRKINTI